MDLIWSAAQKVYRAMPPAVGKPLHRIIQPPWETRRTNRVIAGLAAAITPRAAAHQGKRILVDCGFNSGLVLQGFLRRLPQGFQAYGFDVNARIFSDNAQRMKNENPNILSLDFAAVSDHDGVVDFFEIGDPQGQPFPAQGTTTLREIAAQKFLPSSLQTPAACTVPCVDFSGWLQALWQRHSNGAPPHIVVKMDIEGAEYAVLDKMLRDGTAALVSDLVVEFHERLFPESARRHYHAWEQSLRHGMAQNGVHVHEWI
jgi:FkbM family methyltransferase